MKTSIEYSDKTYRERGKGTDRHKRIQHSTKHNTPTHTSLHLPPIAYKTSCRSLTQLQKGAQQIAVKGRAPGRSQLHPEEKLLCVKNTARYLSKIATDRQQQLTSR